MKHPQRHFITIDSTVDDANTIAGQMFISGIVGVLLSLALFVGLGAYLGLI